MKKILKNELEKNCKNLSLANIDFKFLLYVGLIVFIALFFVEPALAFDIDKGVKAGSAPLIKGIQDHWGKAVRVSGVCAALVGQGDPKTRALQAGVGLALSSVVVLGALSAFS